MHMKGLQGSFLVPLCVLIMAMSILFLLNSLNQDVMC